MTIGNLVSRDDVEAVLVRSLTDQEASALTGSRGLIAQVEAQLRVKRPLIDAWVASWDADPRPAEAVDPVVVGAMLGTVIKRVLINVDGLASESESEGDYSVSRTYAGARRDAAADPGELIITTADLAKLRPATGRLAQISTSPLPYPNVTRGHRRW